ncbi:MBL fold metallo-hydrolase [Novosphingobium sp. PC22D]|uniref:MBL fold metallo-hydrolase n=1 Tax=Novosphingobium sp. PC22D TaxID=1962403 RepID=UPI000BF05124|nr:MBL fold metallo-hydrolase [Novosphingobium sp. PC22D]PEQ11480.1 MBL fold metallo-hydrolase [Novosphingobium sp. PC22D]
MHVRFIGCGDAFGSGGRFNTCFQVVGETTNLLIDCGASSLVAMKQQQVDRNAIRMIVVTHFHADHFGGVPFFILDAQFFARRRDPLTIVGPVGLGEWYRRVMETAFPGSSGAARKFEVRLVEIAAGTSCEVEGVTVHAAQARHGALDAPCLAVRVEAEGRAVAYTGDGEWTDGLVPIARDADLFIAEAYFRERRVATHLGLAEIEAHLAELGPRRLILTHMSDDMLGHPDRPRYLCAEDGLVLPID